MNKKLRKMLAMVSAVVMCTVSMTAISSNAMHLIISDDSYVPTYEEDGIKYTTHIPIDAISFTIGQNSRRIVFWKEATDYIKLIEPNYDDVRIYRIEGTSGFKFHHVFAHTKNKYVNEETPQNSYIDWEFRPGRWADFYSLSPEDADKLKEYLDSKNIEYYTGPIADSDEIAVQLKEKDVSIYMDILENTGCKIGMAYMDDCITDIGNFEVPVPEATLTGDSNEDNDVTIADAVLILQSLSSPDDYKLTIQGIANADMDGDGVTAADALRIQEMLANK